MNFLKRSKQGARQSTVHRLIRAFSIGNGSTQVAPMFSSYVLVLVDLKTL